MGSLRVGTGSYPPVSPEAHSGHAAHEDASYTLAESREASELRLSREHGFYEQVNSGRNAYKM